MLTTLAVADAAVPLSLAMTSDKVVLLAIFCVLSLVAFVALFFPTVRRNNALFAPSLVVTTLAFTIVVVGFLTAAAYRAMGF